MQGIHSVIQSLSIECFVEKRICVILPKINYEPHYIVESWNESGEDIYDGVVAGSEGRTYSVHIDINHPRKSTCNCPFAEGRRVVCKHMIALYLTVKPQAFDDFMKQVEEWEEEEEERAKQHIEDIRKYVKSLSKAELQDELLNMILMQEERKNNY